MKTSKIALCTVAALLLLPGCYEQQKTDTPPLVQPPEPAPPSQMLVVIPGLEASEVVPTFEKQGFAFKIDYMPDRIAYSGQKMDESRATLFCYLSTDKSRKVLNVKYIINGSNQVKEKVDEIAKRYFGVHARIPYDGAKPDQAQEWVIQHAATASSSGNVMRTTIGNVEFELSGTQLERTLLIRPVEATLSSPK